MQDDPDCSRQGGWGSTNADAEQSCAPPRMADSPEGAEAGNNLGPQRERYDDLDPRKIFYRLQGSLVHVCLPVTVQDRERGVTIFVRVGHK